MEIPLPSEPEEGYILNSMKHANALTKQRLENLYYGPEKEANIGYTTASTNKINTLLPYEVPNMLSEIGLRNAQAGLAGQQAKYIPTKYALQSQNTSLRQNEIDQATQNSFRQWTQTPEGQMVIANDPKMAGVIYQQMQKQAAQLGNYPAPQQNQNIPIAPQQSQNMGGYNPASQQNQNVFSASSPIPQQNQNLGGYTPISAPQQNQNASPVSAPQQSQNISANEKKITKLIQQGAEDAYAKTNLPADTKKRLYAGERFKTTIPTVTNNFELAKDYFQPKGLLLLKKDQAQALKGKGVPPRLQAYRKMQQGLEQLNVQGAFLEGVPADQISRGQYNKIYDMDMLLQHPEDARDILYNAINLGLQADQANKSTIGQLMNQGSNDLLTANNKSTPQGMVLMNDPDGNAQYVPKANVQKAIKKYNFTKAQ